MAGNACYNVFKYKIMFLLVNYFPAESWWFQILNNLFNFTEKPLIKPHELITAISVDL